MSVWVKTRSAAWPSTADRRTLASTASAATGFPPGRPGGQPPLWRDGEREAGRGRGDEGRAQEEHPLGTAPAGRLEREGERRPGRALSREEIAKSANLQRRYAQEYASMLRVVPDHEVAKEAARVNVSVLAAGQPRIVPFEGRFSVEELRSALTRGGKDLSTIRSALSRLSVRRTPEISRLQTLDRAGRR